MMTAWNGARVGRWTINRRILLLGLLAPLALIGCPGTNTPSGDGDPAGVDDNVAPNPLLNTPDETLAQGDTLQGQVGETLFFDAAGSVDTDGSVIGYEWNFGDGSPIETAVTVTHSYAATGQYTVTLTVIDNDAERTTLTITVVISSAVPVASFTATPTSGQAPLPVNFDATASTSSNPDGFIPTYEWDFGDESPLVGGDITSHTYTMAGTFTVTLTVTGNLFETDTETLEIVVTAANQLPTAIISDSNGTALAEGEVLDGEVGDLFEFDGAGSFDPDGETLEYAWNFGDESPVVTTAQASHSYAEEGVYTVTLTVTDDDGETDVASVEVNVFEPNLKPTAVISVDVESGPAPLTVQFDGTDSFDPDPGDTVAGYCWLFGDSDPDDCDATGNSTSSEPVTHTYLVEGTYEATLFVNDLANLSSDTVSVTIEVTAPVVVSLAVDTTCLELDPTDPAADTHQLLVTGTLSDNSQADVTADAAYSSDNDLIATVSDGGLITAVTDAEGVATVTVSHTDPDVLPVDVTVYVSDVTLYNLLVTSDPNPVDLLVGETAQLTVVGANICDPSMTMDLTLDLATIYEASDDDPLVAMVDTTGEITAVGVGEATITVSRDDGSAPNVEVPVSVTLEELGGTIDVTGGDPDGDFIVMPGDEIDLDMQATGGSGAYTYDWEVDASQTTNTDTGDEVFGGDDTSQMVTFTPPVDQEGTYSITCSVEDVADPGGKPFVAGPITIIATTLSADPVVENNNGCIVGLPSGNMPCGTCSPGTFTDDQFATMTLLANPSGGVGPLTYSWTSDDDGSFDDPDVQDAEWFVPFVEAETIVTFTVTVTDDLGAGPAELSLPFEVDWTVQPAPELESIGPDPLETTVDVELLVTFVRDLDTGIEPIIFRLFDDDGNPSAVQSDCFGPAQGFDDASEECGFTFDTAGDYLLTIQLKDSCAESTTISSKPKVAYDFMVTVNP